MEMELLQLLWLIINSQGKYKKRNSTTTGIVLHMLLISQNRTKEPQSSEETEAAEPQRPTSITDNKPPPPESPGTSRFIVNLSSVIADECQKRLDLNENPFVFLVLDGPLKD